MESKSPPPLNEVVRASAAYAARTRDGVREGLRDLRQATLRAPRPDEHARRLLFGFAAPLTLFRVAWKDAWLRRQMVERMWPPLLLVALVAGYVVHDVVTSLVEQRHHPSALAAEIEEEDDGDAREVDADSPEGKARAAERARVEKVAREAEAAVEKAARDARDKGLSTKDVAAAAASAAVAQAPLLEAETNHAREEKAKAKAKKAPASEQVGRASALRIMTAFVTSKLARLLAIVGVLEWLLIWIGREHHDVIAEGTARLTGVPSEPANVPARLRLDFRWLKIKAWRTARFFLFVGLASPLTYELGQIPRVGNALGVAVQAAWTAYWASVFAIANSPLAWQSPEHGWAPWFIRLLVRPARLPLLGLPFRFYAWALTRATRAVWPACRAFEAAPWESAGLALARGVASVPGLYLVARPMFAPAATHAFIAGVAPSQAASAPPPPP